MLLPPPHFFQQIYNQDSAGKNDVCETQGQSQSALFGEARLREVPGTQFLRCAVEAALIACLSAPAEHSMFGSQESDGALCHL